MELKKLHQDLISKLRSTFTINTFTQCVMELVYNSLDANSTAVAVRINFVAYRIQIVDNGDGISKENMSQIGNRYMTNKCEGLKDFQKSMKYYGYRGEALASIVECSKSVTVTSRHKETSETCSKILQKNGNEQVSLTRTRPSCGTTITVEGVFYNLAVRRNRIVPELELEDLKTFIQHIIMMHPNVSFTIRDDVSSELLLNSQKHKDIIAAFKYFHPEIDCDFSLLKVSRNKLSVEALLFKELYDNKNAQYIFVNKRPVYAAKLQKYIVSMISKNRKHARQRIENISKVYPVYILNIKCPHALVSYNTDQTKTTVEFADWSLVFRYIEKLVYSFFGNEEKLRQQRKPQPLPPDDFIMDCGPSQINGAVKAYGYKRCNKEVNAEAISEKLPKLKTDNEVESANINSLLRSKTADSITAKLPTLQIEPNDDDLADQNVEETVANGMCDKYFDDVYHISDTTPQEQSKVPFKKPLPITITKQQQSCLFTDMKIPAAQNILQNKPTSALSTITDFTNDEAKGKNLIMDMFLKSTQVFNDCESISDGRSEGTIFEVESDMLLENNITSKMNGCTKTVSISVNVKSKHKLKRKKKSRSKISKCIQTTFRSKSIKSVTVKKGKHETIKAFESVRGHRSPGEYTVVFSNALDPEKKPKFKFISHSSETGSDFMKVNDIDFENCCICKCHSSNTLFNFHRDEQQRASVRDDENARDQDIDCRRKKQNEHDRDPKYNWEIQHNHQQDNLNCRKKNQKEDGDPKYNWEIKHNNQRYSKNQLNQQQADEDSIEDHCDEDNHHLDMGDHEVLPDVETVNGNTKIFNLRKYDKNIMHLPEKNSSDDQVFKMKHKPKNDSNFRYGTTCLNGNAELQQYYTNLNPKGIVKHPYNNEENYCRQQFLQLNCQNMYGATKTCHQSQKYIDVYHSDAIPKLIGCLETKNQNLNSCLQALPSESPYFKRPTIRETNLFHFVEPNRPKLKCKSDVATAQSPYFSKHHHVEAEMNNPQAVESLGNHNAEHDVIVEKQNVFHCPSEQTLSKNFDTQFFTQHLRSGKESEDLFGSANSPHNVFENNTTINSFGQFRPEYLSTQVEGVAKVTDNNVQKYMEKLPLKAPKYSTKKSIASSELCITLSNNQKQNLMVEELEQTKMFDVKKFEEWISQPTKKNQENFLSEGWLKKADKCGNFYYVNKETGYATYNTPNQEAKNCFKVAERYEFVPKGFSPMLVETEPVDRSLSQNKKDKLLEYIMETYQTDLMYIKWRKYMDDIEKVRQYEESIPNIAILEARDKFRKDQISFNKALLLNVKVIGQIDRKFICVLEPKQNLLILSLGLTTEYYTDSVSITEIPSYIYNKFKDKEPGSLAKVVHLLIKELVELLRSTRGSTSSSLPKFLQDIISLEACRGAIKFGDTLSKDQCTDLLTMLPSCNLPFQCAHGRPTLVPLLHLKNTDEKLYVKQKIHFSKIKSCEL
nr:unnamed protein product [Callosobruchus chinensis]